MKRNFLRLVLFVGLVCFILYMVLNKTAIIKEHLTPGPPTLLTLQTDTQDLDSRLTQLKSDFDKMSQQAKQGADASASARAQMNMLKQS
jgi:type IV secretory pathway TrbL component